MSDLKRRTVDATEGVIWKQLLALFYPLWFGTLFQQLYNTVDSVVVGRFVSKAALAAVGCTGTVVNLTVGVFNGIASGAVVVISQQFGARRGDRVEKSVHTAMLSGIIMGALFSLVGFLTAPWVLRIMDTTPDTMADAQLYLRIYFLGMIPNVVYNMGTGVLRAIGDSRRPLYFLIAASLCNIVLDFVFVLGFHWGVMGVAVATVLSQLLSAVLVVRSLLRAKGEDYQLHPTRLELEQQSLRAQLRLGVPAALQAVMYSCANLVMQSAINEFGTDTMAAWTALAKLDAILWMTLSSLGLAVTTFVGQNFGAGKISRLKKGVAVSVWIGMGITIAMSALMFVFARPLVSIFTMDDAVMDIGVQMVRVMMPVYITYVLVELLAGALRGAGEAMAPTIITLFGICILRLTWLLAVVPMYRTVAMVVLAFPITWAATSVMLAIYYCRGHWLRRV